MPNEILFIGVASAAGQSAGLATTAASTTREATHAHLRGASFFDVRG